MTLSAWARLVGAFDYPMFVLTASAGGERSGCLVGFARQCSIDPARFATWVSDKNHTFDVARRAEHASDPGDHVRFQDVKDLDPGHDP